jgi:hypothetical protein
MPGAVHSIISVILHPENQHIFLPSHHPLLAGTAGGSETPSPATNGSDACFAVRDRNGQSLAYANFEEKPSSRAAETSFRRNKVWLIAQRQECDIRAPTNHCYN